MTRKPSSKEVYAAPERRWQAVQDRDARADGSFFYAVVTTGVFCRPSCASRQPLPGNVRFFDEAAAAMAAGFRACKRCRPTGESTKEAAAKRIVDACRLLEGEERLAVEEVAQRCGFSVWYFQRLFRRQIGVTPQDYRRRVVAERAKDGLRSAPTVTTAIYDAGYSSSSRFYDGAARELGMEPRRARSGGGGEELRFTTRVCSVGHVLVAWTPRGVCDVRFGDEEKELVDALRLRFPDAVVERSEVSPWVDLVLAAVNGASAAEAVALDLPLDIRGTAFQQQVWKELRRIPAGETRSYAEIAASIGHAGSARAVAGACAANQLAVVIPCHRAVRSDGTATGYRWGRERRQLLLRREGSR